MISPRTEQSGSSCDALCEPNITKTEGPMQAIAKSPLTAEKSSAVSRATLAADSSGRKGSVSRCIRRRRQRLSFCSVDSHKGDYDAAREDDDPDNESDVGRPKSIGQSMPRAEERWRHCIRFGRASRELAKLAPMSKEDESHDDLEDDGQTKQSDRNVGRER